MRIGVIGGGAWGTALAQVAAANGEPVMLWAREHAVVTAINLAHENTVFLPGVALSPSVRATGELSDLNACDAWLIVMPVGRTTCRSSAHPGAADWVTGIES